MANESHSVGQVQVRPNKFEYKKANPSLCSSSCSPTEMKLHLIIGLVLLWTVSASETKVDTTSPAEAKDTKDVPVESADDVEERLLKFKKPVPVPIPVPVRTQVNKQVTKLLLVRPVGVVDTVNSPASLDTDDDPTTSVLSALGNIQSLPVSTAVFNTLLRTGQLGKLSTTPRPQAARPNPTRPYPIAGPSYPNNYKPPTHYPAPSDNQNQQYNYPEPYPSHYQYPAYGNSPNHYPSKLVAIPIETSETTMNSGSLINLLASFGVRTK